MKELCVNKTKFQKFIRYSIWIIISGFLITYSVISYIEGQNLYFPEKINEFNGGTYIPYCYHSILTNQEVCHCGDGICLGETSAIRPEVLVVIIADSINAIIFGYWIYSKQPFIKFSWCLTNGSES